MMTVTMEMTAAKIGRSMKKREMFIDSLVDSLGVEWSGRRARSGLRRSRDGLLLGLDDDVGPRPLDALHDDAVVGRETLAYDPQAVVHRTAGDLPVADLVVAVHHPDELLGLVALHGIVGNEQRLVSPAADEPESHEQSGREQAVGVGNDGALLDRPGAAVDLVVHEVHVALVREALLVG